MKQTLETTSTLGELSRAYPSLIPCFWEKGLDFCCGGNQTIAELCAERRWDPDGFLAELSNHLEAAGPVPSWEPGSQAPLIDYILERFHEGHRRDFATLEGLVAKVTRVHGARWPRLHEIAELVSDLITDIEPHMMKEERILFPIILGLAGHPVGGLPPMMSPRGPIQVMLMEHEQVGRILDKLVEATDRFTPPEWACNTLRGLFALLEKLNLEIRLHVHLENNVLFPMVPAMA